MVPDVCILEREKNAGKVKTEIKGHNHKIFKNYLSGKDIEDYLAGLRVFDRILLSILPV
jgi:hypothetical protein